jgi:Fe-S-cluster containining protein
MALGTARASRSVEDELTEAVAAVLDAVDRELAAVSPGCDACGKCCDFEDGQRVLFASTLEVDFLVRGAGPGRPTKRRICPYLTGQKCGARPFRPLGCRTFFCSSRHPEALQSIHEKHHRELAELARRRNLEWRYAPLLDQLFRRPPRPG